MRRVDIENQSFFKRLTIFCFLFMAMIFCLEGSKGRQKIKILTGKQGRLYHSFIEDTIARLTENSITLDNKELLVFNTPGSVFNIDLILTNRANYALAQADVISETQSRNGNSLHGVAPLFREYVFIFQLLVKPKVPGVVDLDAFSIKTINFPSRNSGTHLTGERFLKVSGIDQSKAVYRDINESLKMIINEKLWGSNDYIFAVLSLDDPLIKDIGDGWLDGYDSSTAPSTPVWRTNGEENEMKSFYDSLDLVFPDWHKGLGYPVQFVSILPRHTTAMKELYGIYETTSISIPIQTDQQIRFGSLSTFFMRAFLVTRSDEKKATVETLLGYLAKDATFKKMIKKASPDTGEDRDYRWPIPIHSGAYETLTREAVIEKNTRPSLLLIIFGVLVFIFLLQVLLVVRAEYSITRRKKENTRKGYVSTGAIRQLFNHFFGNKLFVAILSVISLILLYVLAAVFIDQIEEMASKIYGFKSPFNRMGIEEVLVWLFTHIFSGTPQGVFPSFPSSIMIFTLLNIALKLIAPTFVFVYLVQWFREYSRNKSGLKKRRLSNHVVFIGWDKTYNPVIKKVVEADEFSRFVIITPEASDHWAESDLPLQNIRLIFGSPLDKKVLEKASIKKSRAIYLISSSREKGNYPLGFPVAVEKFIFHNFRRKYLYRNFRSIRIRTLVPEKNSKIFEEIQDEVPQAPGYGRMVRSLFFGSGIYPLLSYWVHSRLHKKTGNTDEPFLSEKPLDHKELPYLEKKWLTRAERKQGSTPFQRLLDTSSTADFIDAYTDLDKLFWDKQCILAGLSLEYSVTDNLNKTTWEYFSMPREYENTQNEHLERVSIKSVKKAVLYIMA